MESIWARGRDNARTPMQWTGEEGAGFTTGTPWLPVNPNHREINAQAALADPDSVFHYYRKLIELRKTMPVLREGGFELLCPGDERVFAYTRDMADTHLLVVCNFTGEETDFDWPEEFAGGKVLISNYEGESRTLRPYEAKVICCSTF